MTAQGRFTPAMKWALGGFVAAAAISLMIPATILESFISAIGLPEMIAASAPPLGVKARLIIALFCGIVAAAIVFAFGPGKRGAQDEYAGYEDDDANSEAKPTIMDRLRGLTSRDDDNGIRDLSDLPKIRSADAHPDAPVRRPLFAGEDLADPSPLAVKPFAEEEMEAAPMPAPSEAHREYEAAYEAEPEYDAEPEYEDGLDMEYAEFVPEEAHIAEPEPAFAPEPEVAPEPEPESAQVAPESIRKAQPSHADADLSDLPINELVDRLEQSLAALKNGTAPRAQAEPVQSMPEPAPVQQSAPEPVRDMQQKASEKREQPSTESDTVQSADDMDEALKAALATLQRMTSK